MPRGEPVGCAELDDDEDDVDAEVEGSGMYGDCARWYADADADALPEGPASGPATISVADWNAPY